MASDSVSSFLDHAREHRLLPPEQVEHLFRQPDVPQESLASLCDFLQERGVLTPFQADRIRSGRRRELTYAGYALTDELGTCPGGRVYRAIHPSLRTPLQLRRLDPAWLTPSDNVAAYVGRARDASSVSHPYLAPLLDAGVSEEDPFVVLEPIEGVTLEEYVTTHGPMAYPQACTYLLQAAEALAHAHDRGVMHGDLHPALIVITPAEEIPGTDGNPPTRRPAERASVRVCELGLVPRRPHADLPESHRPYHAPESADGIDPTPAGDVYALGACAWLALTGQAFTPGVLGTLASEHPGIPADVESLVTAMLDADPAARPTAQTVAERLIPFATAQQQIPAATENPATSDILGGAALNRAMPDLLAPLTLADEPVQLETTEPVALTPTEEPPAEPDAEAGAWMVSPVSDSQAGDDPPLFPVEAALPEAEAQNEGVPADLFASNDSEPSPFATAPSATSPGAQRARQQRDPKADRERLKMWFMVGAGFWVVAGILWLVLLNQAGCFGGSANAPQQSGPKSYRGR